MGKGTSPLPALFPLHPCRRTSSASLSLFPPASFPLIFPVFPVFSELLCSLSPRCYSLPSASAAARLSRHPPRTASLSPSLCSSLCSSLPPSLCSSLSPSLCSSLCSSSRLSSFPFLSTSSLRCGAASSSVSPAAGVSPASSPSLLLFASSPPSLAAAYAPRRQLRYRATRQRLRRSHARRAGAVASLRLRKAFQSSQPAPESRRTDALSPAAEPRRAEDSRDRVETCAAASEKRDPSRQAAGRRKPIDGFEARAAEPASARSVEGRRTASQQERSRAWRCRAESGRDAEREARGSRALEEKSPRRREAATGFQPRLRRREGALDSEKEDYATLVETLRACDRAYHMHGFSLLPDPVYDQLKTRLLLTEEAHPSLVDPNSPSSYVGSGPFAARASLGDLSPSSSLSTSSFPLPSPAVCAEADSRSSPPCASSLSSSVSPSLLSPSSSLLPASAAPCDAPPLSASLAPCDAPPLSASLAPGSRLDGGRAFLRPREEPRVRQQTGSVGVETDAGTRDARTVSEESKVIFGARGRRRVYHLAPMLSLSVVREGAADRHLLYTVSQLFKPLGLAWLPREAVKKRNKKANGCSSACTTSASIKSSPPSPEASRPMPPQTPFPVAFLAEPKIDGISCALRFRARVLDSALRRPPTLPLAGDVVTLSVTASGLFGAVPPSEGEDAPASPGASASLEDLSGAPVQSASASASAASSSPSTFSSLVLWEFVDASSRGNGVWGEDISHTVRAMSEAGRLPLAFATRLRSAQPLSPATLSRWLLEVRGELFLSRSNFRAYVERRRREGRTPPLHERHAARGIADTGEHADLLSFAAYGLVEGTDETAKAQVNSQQLFGGETDPLPLAPAPGSHPVSSVCTLGVGEAATPAPAISSRVPYGAGSASLENQAGGDSVRSSRNGGPTLVASVTRQECAETPKRNDLAAVHTLATQEDLLVLLERLGFCTFRAWTRVCATVDEIHSAFAFFHSHINGAKERREGEENAVPPLRYSRNLEAAEDLVREFETPQSTLVPLPPSPLSCASFSELSSFTLPQSLSSSSADTPILASPSSSSASFPPLWDLPADGVVFKVNEVSVQLALGNRATGPRWAFARKFPQPFALSKIRDFVFSVGQFGSVHVVAALEPVRFGNLTVCRASVGTLETLSRRQLAVGDEVYVHLSGHTTPLIVGIKEALGGSLEGRGSRAGCESWRLRKNGGETRSERPQAEEANEKEICFLSESICASHSRSQDAEGGTAGVQSRHRECNLIDKETCRDRPSASGLSLGSPAAAEHTLGGFPTSPVLSTSSRPAATDDASRAERGSGEVQKSTPSLLPSNLSCPSCGSPLVFVPVQPISPKSREFNSTRVHSSASPSSNGSPSSSPSTSSPSHSTGPFYSSSSGRRPAGLSSASPLPASSAPLEGGRLRCARGRGCPAQVARLLLRLLDRSCLNVRAPSTSFLFHLHASGLLHRPSDFLRLCFLYHEKRDLIFSSGEAPAAQKPGRGEKRRNCKRMVAGPTEEATTASHLTSASLSVVNGSTRRENAFALRSVDPKLSAQLARPVHTLQSVDEEIERLPSLFDVCNSTQIRSPPVVLRKTAADDPRIVPKLLGLKMPPPSVAAARPVAPRRIFGEERVEAYAASESLSTQRRHGGRSGIPLLRGWESLVKRVVARCQERLPLHALIFALSIERLGLQGAQQISRVCGEDLTGFLHFLRWLRDSETRGQGLERGEKGECSSDEAEAEGEGSKEGQEQDEADRLDGKTNGFRGEIESEKDTRSSGRELRRTEDEELSVSCASRSLLSPLNSVAFSAASRSSLSSSSSSSLSVSTSPLAACLDGDYESKLSPAAVFGALPETPAEMKLSFRSLPESLRSRLALVFADDDTVRELLRLALYCGGGIAWLPPLGLPVSLKARFDCSSPSSSFSSPSPPRDSCGTSFKSSDSSVSPSSPSCSSASPSSSSGSSSLSPLVVPASSS
ncbi:putative DNA ligase (NAD+) [Toxoplasma gondii VAND]|uniref:Putative DNA ligase (NAD+) n=1 Tax=Toxoplasma gondii VAND TaxID=933077 RepID=A0A086PP87_TOXGO|nr:putative DNA ligase (NAD+) [Toxoplasma gondii VAND]